MPIVFIFIGITAFTCFANIDFRGYERARGEREKNCAYCCHNSNAIRSPNVAVCTNKNEERTNRKEMSMHSGFALEERQRIE